MIINVDNPLDVDENFDSGIGGAISISALGSASSADCNISLSVDGGALLSTDQVTYGESVFIECTLSACNDLLANVQLRLVEESEENVTLTSAIAAFEGDTVLVDTAFQIAVAVNPINSPPRVQIVGSIATNEDDRVMLGTNVVEITDSDAFVGEVFILDIASSVLFTLNYVDAGADVTVTVNSERSIRIVGELAELRFAVGSVVAVPEEHEFGSGVVTLTVRDSSGAISPGSNSIPVTVTPVDDAPQVELSPTTFVGLEGDSVILGRIATVTDADLDTLTLSVTVSAGTLSISASASVTDIDMGASVSGEAAILSDAFFILLLDGTTVNGPIEIVAVVSDGESSAEATAVVMVGPVNSGPSLEVIAVETAFDTNEGENVIVALNFAVVSDVEEGSPEAGTYSLGLSVNNGGSLFFSGSSMDAEAELVLEGDLQSIRDVIATQNLVIVPPINFDGLLEVFVSLDDGSMIPTNSAQSVTRFLASVRVTSIVDPVVINVGVVDVVPHANNTVTLSSDSIGFTDLEGDDDIIVNINVGVAVIVSFDDTIDGISVDFFPPSELNVTGTAAEISKFVDTIVVGEVVGGVLNVSVTVVYEGNVTSNVPMATVNIVVTVPSLLITAEEIIVGTEDASGAYYGRCHL